MAGPRLCALRIQNGTSNILLDNIEQSDGHTATAAPVVYTRRPRFLDEELDETKDIITSPSRPTAAPVTVSIDDNVGGPHEIIIIGSHAVNAPPAVATAATVVPSLRKDLLSGSSMSISTTTNDRSPQLEPVILSSAAAARQQLFEPPTTNTGNRGGIATVMPLLDAAVQSGTGAGSADVPTESTSLRRQQLSRVAEWVQSNHLVDCVNGIGEPATTMAAGAMASMSPLSVGGRKLMLLDGGGGVGGGTGSGHVLSSATSIDSGYKTKGAHRNNNAMNATNACASPIGGDYAQNLSNNNNHADAVERGQRSSGDGCTTTEETRSTSEASAANAAEEAKAQSDFAQMEYNVKQFLLKQNEWSTPPQQPGATSAAPANVRTHRTETNL